MHRLSFSFLSLLILFLFWADTVYAQAPLVLELREQTEVAEGTKLYIFGLFFTGTTNITVAPCEGVIDDTEPNDDNNLFVIFRFEDCPDGAIGPVLVTNAFGTGVSFFSITLPDGPSAPTLPAVPYGIVSTDVPQDSLVNTMQIDVDADISGIVKRRGAFLWEVPFPVSDPAPTTRFADPDDADPISRQLSYDTITGDSLELALADIFYFIQVDSSLIVDLSSEGLERKEFYFSFYDSVFFSEYPLFEGLGNSWVRDIDPGFDESYIDGEVSLIMREDTATVELGSNTVDLEGMITTLDQFFVFGDTLLVETTVELSGEHLGYTPRFDFRFEGLNGPLPMIIHNSTSIETSAPGTTVSVSFPQQYAKYFDATPIGGATTSTFYIKNIVDSLLTYDTFTFDITGDDAGSFSITSAPSNTIGVGDSTAFDISFQPADNVGAHSAMVTITAGGESYYAFSLHGDAETALPVELVTFTGMMDDEDVLLTWQTATELNNAGFEVQRRLLGETEDTWEVAGFVKGHGTTSEARTYHFRDADLPYDAGKLRYRLKQVDTDGTFAFTEEITVELPGVTTLTLEPTYPNPARDLVTVRFAVPSSSMQEGQVVLELYDVLGRRVHRIMQDPEESRTEMTIDLYGLSAGVYFLRLAAGGEARTRQVTVVR